MDRVFGHGSHLSLFNENSRCTFAEFPFLHSIFFFNLCKASPRVGEGRVPLSRWPWPEGGGVPSYVLLCSKQSLELQGQFLSIYPADG